MSSHSYPVGGGSYAGDGYIGLPFFSVLERVMTQVEYPCFMDLRVKSIDPLYKELCLIMAEVLVLGRDDFIKINGSLIPVQLVKEVYLMLRHDHVRLVFDNFHNVSHRVHNKKAYLRTALYNAVFEIESHFVNAFVDPGYRSV